MRNKTKTTKLSAIANTLMTEAQITSFEPFALETDGKTYVSLRGGCSIGEYEKDRIRFLCGETAVILEGGDFELAVYSENDALIYGKISNINFCSAGGEKVVKR